MAIYLTCTRRSGQQKKHVDVCRRCDLNATCRTFQEYLQTETAPPGTSAGPVVSDEKPAGNRRLPVQIIADLVEIRQLLANPVNKPPVTRRRIESYPPAVPLKMIQAVLAEIKAYYDA